METTLTMENLLAIFQAMDRIKPIDRSEYFNNYYQELISRLQTESKVKEWIEGNLNLIVQGNSQETDRDRQEFTPGEGSE
jgi:hypothetical protein